MNKDIGQRIMMLRGKKAQAVFAKQIGVSLRAYRYYESGDRVPPGTVLVKIADLCSVTVDWIFTGVERPDRHLKVFAPYGGLDTITEEICTRLMRLGNKEKEDLLSYIEFLEGKKKKKK